MGRSPLLERQRVAQTLDGEGPPLSELSVVDTAGVLFLVQDLGGDRRDPLLLLTKRSQWVKQAGDLCCPGGRVHHRVDNALGRLLTLPGSPLTRGLGWKIGKSQGASWKRYVGLYWACALRESWEEMGLRPWGVEFLGLLPLYRLAFFSRGIFPLVGWINGRRRLRLNWEVERLVRIPFSSLLSAENYGAYLLDRNWREDEDSHPELSSYPCFVHEDELGREVLWGATYRIVTWFLERVFGFNEPPMKSRPVVTGKLDSAYATGRPLRG